MRHYLIGLALAAVALAQTGDRPSIERPRRFRLDGEGWTVLIGSGAVAGLDYYSTRCIISAGGYERNQTIADGRGVNYKKAVLIDAANIGSVLAYEGFAKHLLPPRYRWIGTWIVQPAIAAGIGFRSRAVVNNFRLLAGR